jgi:D-glycero-D-manno-heptose 1,7-bisphosphate phosphatase
MIGSDTHCTWCGKMMRSCVLPAYCSSDCRAAEAKRWEELTAVAKKVREARQRWLALIDTVDLVIFDADGTLCTTASGQTFRRGAADWKVLPRRPEVLQELATMGKGRALASNQGGVAFGHLKDEEISAELYRLGAALGIVVVWWCPHHPQGTVPGFTEDCPHRKPKPGMLTGIMEQQGASPERTLFVGDRPEDQQAAQAAGTRFAWAWEFFEDPEPLAASPRGV